jgi:serine/threonine-protein kinase
LTQKLVITRQIAAALSAAHARNLVHRDLKPSNIMVRADGAAKLLDFGIARALAANTRLTRTGQMLGTPAYMSPEQISSLKIDARSDVFSFGVVLYELFTGIPPFKGEHEIALAYSIVNENPPTPLSLQPDLPPALSDLIMSMLAKLPSQRCHDMEEALSTLESVSAHP